MDWVFRETEDDLLLSYISWLPKRADLIAWIGGKAKTSDISSMTADRLAQESPGPNVRYFSTQSQALMEMFLCRIVDNFQNYIIDIIRLALKTEPRMLYSKDDSVPLADLLSANSLTEVLHKVVEAKVSKLSYKSFSALQAWANSRGIPIQEPDDLDTTVEEIIATRNIVVHNRGIVNEIYKALVPSSQLKIGDLRGLTEADLKSMVEVIRKTCKTTDALVVEKFGLPVLTEGSPLDSAVAARMAATK
jgi:hypothetical protein